MVRKERFALLMKDGAEVRNIDDLKAHFDIGSVVKEFKDGRLLTWLENRYYDEEAVAIIRSKEPIDFDKLNITFKKIRFDDDYQKVLPEIESPKVITYNPAEEFARMMKKLRDEPEFMP